MSSTSVVAGRWQPPSRLKALAFAVEHSPRDWERFQREQDELDEIDELKEQLRAMDAAASQRVQEKAIDAAKKGKKHKLTVEERERKLLAIKLTCSKRNLF